MDSKYQLVVIGHENEFHSQIIETFLNRVDDLGVSRNTINILDNNNFLAEYVGNVPTVGIYFGQDYQSHPDIDILDKLISDSNMVIPVVSTFVGFQKQLPEQLHPINGFELNDQKTEALVGRILEGLSLLRLSRRLFISYKRSESTGVAIQLFERLEQAGFDVFLDTHSIRQGEVFQDELWHRMVDTDVVILLNTKGFLESDWTPEELAKASAMSIGILQVIWPNHNPERSSELSIPLKLQETDFEQSDYSGSRSILIQDTVDKIIEGAESLRARSLGARQDNIITEFISAAKDNQIVANLQPEKVITIDDQNGEEIIVIPTIGVPQAVTYNQSADLVKTIREHGAKQVLLLYDHINIREKWLKHLAWLDQYLPVNTLKILEIDNWLKKLKS